MEAEGAYGITSDDATLGAGGIAVVDDGKKLVMPIATGWERNDKGKLGPRIVDLGAMMDPLR